MVQIDVDDGNIIKAYSHPAAPVGTADTVTSISGSSDGRYIYVGRRRSVQVFDVQSGKCMHTITTGCTHVAAAQHAAARDEARASKVGRPEDDLGSSYLFFAYGNSSFLRLFDASTMKCLRTYSAGAGVGAGAGAGASSASKDGSGRNGAEETLDLACCSLDGSYLYASPLTEIIHKFDVENGQLLETFHVGDANQVFIDAMAISPDGSSLFVCGPAVFALLDTATGTVLNTFETKGIYIYIFIYILLIYSVICAHCATVTSTLRTVRFYILCDGFKCVNTGRFLYKINHHGLVFVSLLLLV